MTRANTEHPAAGGGHKDALEHGAPKDARSEGAGHSDNGTGYTPASGENREEKGDYGSVETGNAKGAGGPMPSTSKIHGARGTIGDGRGSSGKFRGTMGGGAPEGEPPMTRAKGAMGNC